MNHTNTSTRNDHRNKTGFKFSPKISGKDSGHVISRRVVIVFEEVQTTFCSLSPKYLKRTADLEFRRKQSRKQTIFFMTSRKAKGRLIIAATRG